MKTTEWIDQFLPQANLDAKPVANRIRTAQASAAGPPTDDEFAGIDATKSMTPANEIMSWPVSSTVAAYASLYFKQLAPAGSASSNQVLTRQQLDQRAELLLQMADAATRDKQKWYPFCESLVVMLRAIARMYCTPLSCCPFCARKQTHTI